MTTKPGYFFLVVGPSGAGKDSLMDGAKQQLSADAFVFAKRIVTRPPGMVGEDYESCPPEQFKQRQAAGEFLQTWQAHGYQYGLSKQLAKQQAQGRHIIANGSRSIVTRLNTMVANLVVIYVSAPMDVLAQRLAKRGRETAAEIKKRLERERLEFPASIKVMTVNNDASLELGIERFMRAIRETVADN